MPDLLFGTAGIPHSTHPSTTPDGIRRVAALGLQCMEIEFVEKIYLNEAEAKAMAGVSRNNNIKLSVHAPYYLNLNSHEPRKFHASQGLLHRAARIANFCGAESIVFHAGFYMGDPAEEAYQTIKIALKEVLDKLDEENNPILLRPEVSGKRSQFGTVEELMRLTLELPRVAPCVDFAHWHARSGSFNSYVEFDGLLTDIEKKLGRPALEDMHIHVSGIEYGNSGEKRHLPIKESDLRYEELLHAWKDHDIKGRVICESPIQEEDALLLQQTYQKWL
jgi:deoxyribonuclease-4